MRTAEATAQARERAAGANSAETGDAAEADVTAVRLFGASYTALEAEERKIVRLAIARALQSHDRLSSVAAPVRVGEPSQDN